MCQLHVKLEGVTTVDIVLILEVLLHLTLVYQLLGHVYCHDTVYYKVSIPHYILYRMEQDKD